MSSSDSLKKTLPVPPWGVEVTQPTFREPGGRGELVAGWRRGLGKGWVSQTCRICSLSPYFQCGAHALSCAWCPSVQTLSILYSPESSLRVFSLSGEAAYAQQAGLGEETQKSSCFLHSFQPILLILSTHSLHLQFHSTCSCYSLSLWKILQS